ncbi:MAG: nitroreductase family protein [Verrucomicrobia bacterium]|nr:nitroreductase family protein [Verrucomicrobiota bacterium]
MKHTVVLFLTLFLSATVHAQNIELPAPHKTGGLPLMEALAKRCTSREFDPRELSPQQLSDLTWAACGFNRSNGKRTAPSSRNKQEVELYLLMKSGAYVYDAAKHALRQISTEDLRQFGAKTAAALCVVYVGDLSKLNGPVEERKATSAVNTGFIGQNIYLYCASEGLVTGYHSGGIDRAALAPKLNLHAQQAILAAQPVSYPKP